MNNIQKKTIILAASLFATCSFAESVTANGISTFTDSRDGKTYRTVKIGSQTWMAENLNYEMNPSWCFENQNKFCKRYGRYYHWEEATRACPAGWHLPSNSEFEMLIKAANGSGEILKSKNGWPSYSYCTDPECNWDPIYDYGCDCEGRLEEVDGNGSDKLGFNALYSKIGLHENTNDSPVAFNVADVPGTCFWSSTNDDTPNESSTYYCMALFEYDSIDMYIGCERDGTLGNPDVLYSVRCVKD